MIDKLIITVFYTVVKGSFFLLELFSSELITENHDIPHCRWCKLNFTSFYPRYLKHIMHAYFFNYLFSTYVC